MAGRPKKVIKEEVAPEAVYPKRKLLAMEKYKDRVDLLGALLDDGEVYSQTEADAKLKEFLNN